MNSMMKMRHGLSVAGALAVMIAALALSLVALAQESDQGAAPGNLVAEVADNGILLRWEAPTDAAGPVTGYEVQGRHLQPGEGILRKLTGNSGSRNTAFTDRTATSTDLRYVYRVRALHGETAGPWSSYVTVAIGQELLSTPVVRFEPTEIIPEAPVEPTARPETMPEPTVASALPAERAPTQVVPVAPPGEPTAMPVAPEPTEASALPEPTRMVPVAPVEPTARPETAPEPTRSA